MTVCIVGNTGILMNGTPDHVRLLVHSGLRSHHRTQVTQPCMEDVTDLRYINSHYIILIYIVLSFQHENC